jgi:hypothetical protein
MEALNKMKIHSSDYGKPVNEIEGGFQTDFWSPMFSKAARKHGLEEPPPTLRLLCYPDSPALAELPTEYHSNWQWSHLVKNSRPVIFDDTPDSYRPTVQVIDNFVRNHKIEMIAETKVGKSGMLICAIDLLGHQDKPEARQLLHSLLRYLDSRVFAPNEKLEAKLLKRLLP